MRTLQLSDDQARKLYPTAAPEFKAMLVDSFGEPFFKVRKPFNQILTLDDVFEATGEDPNDPKFHEGPADEIGYRLVKLLPLALNPTGWTPDWNNGNQRKWQPYFWLNSPGFRFGVSDCTDASTVSAGSSRLRFAEEAISDHAGKQFLDIYKQWMV